jgi:sialidase-1
MILRKIFIISCINILVIPAAFSQKNTKPLWHGFEKENFSFNSRDAYIVKPLKAIPGNPWIWRAYFPDWHYEMDSILLSRGFHIAFINCNDMYGSPAAMQVWEGFYQHLVTNYSFAQKVALEGVSRGGFYVYNWAKRNPDKVSCIYGEAPVLDIKSWPGGKGKGKGNIENWKQCLSVFSLTEESAMNFTDNPIDHLESLAAYKVPLIHVVCKSDSIVPVEENTSILRKRYLQLGGIIRVDTMWDNITASGHHFTITNPEKYADFISQHSVPVKNIRSSSSYIEHAENLNNTLYKINNEKKLTVAFLGGSITYNAGWRDKVSQYLIGAYPTTSFTFIPAGIPSLGSLPHSFRLRTDVLDKGNIDLLFLEAAVNDHANGTDSMIQLKSMEGIIRHALTTNPSMNIVVMAFADEEKIRNFEKNVEPLEVKVHRQLAAFYHLPFINLAKEVYERIGHGEFTWNGDFKNLHPSPYGQNLYFQSIKTMLQLAEGKNNNGKIIRALLPEPLNKNCYSTGEYADIHLATKLHGFSVVEQWKPTDQKATREGFVNVPVLEATKPESSFAFSFTGNAVGIAIVSGPDAGIIEYRIDKGQSKMLNLITKSSNSLHLPRYLILSDGLESGSHELEVKIKSIKDISMGNACRVVHFLVNK